MIIRFAILALIALVATGNAQIALDPAVSLPVGSQPEGIAAADFDGDGDIDFAVVVEAPDRIEIRLNGGGGAFAVGTPILTGGGTSPHALAAGDMNGDTLADLVVTLKGIDQARVYINQGMGLFAMGGSAATGSDPRFLDLADLDGDLDLDVVTSNRNSSTVSVIINQGSGALSTTATLTVAQEARGIDAADLDGDGDADIAVADHDASAMVLFTNQGGGSFTAGAILSLGAQIKPDEPAAADLDGDGDLDLAVTASGGGFNVIAVFTNNGGTFTGPATYATGGLNPSDLVVADLDGDGDADVACTNQDSNQVSALANNGAGSFGAPSLFAVGTTPQDIAAADFDGDGGLDLLVSNRDSNDVSYLHNQGGGTPPVASQALLATPSIGTAIPLQCSSPSDAGRAYLCGFSISSVPGVLLSDGRTFPVNFDEMFLLSITFGNPFFLGTIGALNGGGNATVTIAAPNYPPLIGATIFSSFVTFDPAASLGISNISFPATAVTFAP